MPRARTIHRCTDCGSTAHQWAGRCAACGAWGTLVEELDERAAPASSRAALGDRGRPSKLGDVDLGEFIPRPTGIVEFDRVLGGGFVPGSVTLLGGEPGVGKSTLLLQALVSVTFHGGRALLVSAEESAQQVRARAERLGVLPETLWILPETSMPAILAGVEEVDPDLVVIDSIQTVTDPESGGAPGSVVQVRDCAHRLVEVAKRRSAAVVLVGHVTKDGALAGPRVLEHLVDTVLSFEGDRHHGLRMLRAVKHRFGPTGELGLFEMGGDGLRDVPDPSGLLLGDRRPGLPGSVVVPAIEGSRPLLVEVQALVAPSSLATPRRSAQGVDSGRLALLVAVLQQRCDLPLAPLDVYVSAVGGVRVGEPAGDLAIALAVVSSATGTPIDPKTVVVGEVGLGGEVRQVASISRRLAEAARLGFSVAVVPPSVNDAPPRLRLVHAGTLLDAVGALGLDAGPSR